MEPAVGAYTRRDSIHNKTQTAISATPMDWCLRLASGSEPKSGSEGNEMRMTRAILQCAISILLAAVPLLAGDVKVIANPSVQADALTLSELKAVFLRYSNSLKDGSHVEPVIEQGGAVHDTFVRQYLGKSSDELQTYYDTLVFT